MSSTISADKLRQEIQIILQNADLNTLSSKKVRQMLEELFQCDLTERKKEIDDIVMAEITTRDIQPMPTNNQSNSIGEQRSSQIGNVQLLADGNNSKTNQDKGMETQQQENRPTTQQSNSSTSTTVYKKPTTAQPLKIERRRTCYNKELDISDQLAAVVGGYRMPRSEVVKRMWTYFKDHNLMDPVNKQWVNCDETLSKIFGRKRVRAFGMLKDLSRHMSDPDKHH